MKKIKLLTSILAISPIATIAIPMTSCGDKTYKFDTTGSSSNIKFKVERNKHESDLFISYTYEVSDPDKYKIDISESDIKIGDKSIKDDESIQYRFGVIIIPYQLITDTVHIKLISAEKNEYSISTTGSDATITSITLKEGETGILEKALELNNVWVDYEETTTMKLDKENSDITITTSGVATSIKNQCQFYESQPRLYIPQKLFTGDLNIKLVLKEKESYSITTTGSSDGITWTTPLPKKWFVGQSDITAEYTINDISKKIDESNSDITVTTTSGTTSIKGQCEYKSGTIKIPTSAIPSAFITGAINVKLVLTDKTSYTITNSSEGVTWTTALPSKWYEGQGDITAVYTYDSDTMIFDEAASDITVNGVSIVEETGVEYKNGTVKIPANLITNNIVVKIVAYHKPGELNNTVSEIISACNTYEASSRTETDKKTFINSFKIGSDTLTDVNSLIGSTFSIDINGVSHEVRIIDFEHDTMSDSNTKAALTFEMVTLLSDSSGDKMTSKWDTANCYDYTNSTLRANLNGAGDTSKKTWTSTGLEMLPTVLQSNIKTVNKQVATSTDSGSTFNVVTYQDQLFPLTFTEMGETGQSQYAKVEGSAYKFWENNQKESTPETARIKTDVNSNEFIYWLHSPCTGVEISKVYRNAWAVTTTGEIAYNYGGDVANTNAVSFAFCI